MCIFTLIDKLDCYETYAYVFVSVTNLYSYLLVKSKCGFQFVMFIFSFDS